jgi:putative DNA primase/helicase
MKTYLRVPFDEKDDAISLCCLWDPDVKLWYIGPNSDPMAVKIRFDIAADKATLFYIPYTDKDIAKKLGAQWNTKKKMWYSPRSNSAKNYQLLSEKFDSFASTNDGY